MTAIRHADRVVAAALAASLGACSVSSPPKPAVDTAKIAAAVKADVAQSVADLNAHDPAKYASHDAPDTVAMDSGEPNAIGPAEHAARFRAAIAADPAFKVALVDEKVDVSASGDMAVYRSIYTHTETDPKTGKVGTGRVNYLAGYRPQPDGSWKIVWSVASDIGEPAKAPPPSQR